MIFGPLFHVVRHIRWQLIFFMSVTVSFCGALAATNRHTKPMAAAFSFLATLPVGVLELIPGLLVQMDSNDADLGTVFGEFNTNHFVAHIFNDVFSSYRRGHEQDYWYNLHSSIRRHT
jgi:hypothetical protein